MHQCGKLSINAKYLKCVGMYKTADIKPKDVSLALREYGHMLFKCSNVNVTLGINCRPSPCL